MSTFLPGPIFFLIFWCNMMRQPQEYPWRLIGQLAKIFRAKKLIISRILATRWGRGGLETSKMDSARVKTYNSTYLPGLNSIRGPNGDIGDGLMKICNQLSTRLIHPPTTNNQPSTFAISSNTYFIDRVVFSPFWALFWGFKLDFNPSTGKKLLGPPP